MVLVYIRNRLNAPMVWEKIESLDCSGVPETKTNVEILSNIVCRMFVAMVLNDVRSPLPGDFFDAVRDSGRKSEVTRKFVRLFEHNF